MKHESAITNKTGGESLYNLMTEEKEHTLRGRNWNPHGLTVSDKLNYHVVTNEKLQDLRARTIDRKAVPCIIPMIGELSRNSNGWVLLRKQLEIGNIKFLCSMSDKQTELEDTGDYYHYSAEELANVLAPYGETDMLITEAVNLSTEIKQDKIVLKEPRNGTKDRIVVLSYVNQIIDKIENEWNVQLADEIDYDIDDIKLVY